MVTENVSQKPLIEQHDAFVEAQRSADERERDALQEHVHGTYGSLRAGLTAIGILFPLLLVVIGYLWYGVEWQTSMSAYYHAEAPSPAPGQAPSTGPIRNWLAQSPVRDVLYLDQFDTRTPMRSWFVGTLFALGILLLLYKGFSPRENLLLNAAGTGALGVALFPMGWDCANRPCTPATLHGFSAISAFFFLMLVAVFCAKESLEQKRLTPEREKHYRQRYNWAGWAMVGFPVLAFLITLIVGKTTHFIYATEALGLFAFAYYWWTKGKEFEETGFEKDALEGKVKQVRETANLTVRGVQTQFPSYRLE